jgi:tripartite-type tricarboxylate transporter receptor subunit TctC
MPEVTAKLADLGLEVIGGTPDEFARSIQRQRENYGRLVKVSGAKAD